MDRPYRVLWQPGAMTVHASSPEEAVKIALEYLAKQKEILICARPMNEPQESEK